MFNFPTPMSLNQNLLKGVTLPLTLNEAPLIAATY